MRYSLNGIPFKKIESTGTGAQQTHAHGFSSKPGNISVVPNADYTSVTRLYADSTNIYLVVTNGKGYTLTISMI